MSTNFYLITKNKQQAEKWFKYEYNLTDEPYWGYEIHIAKTSMGWLPLFEAHKNIRSIKQLKECYDSGDFEIIDEYCDSYNWQEFEKRVLGHNGGIDGAVEKHPRMIDYDDGLPKYVPISHFQLNDDDGDYFKDEKGYEFLEGEFV